ncbi:SMa0974 family conjugal transfer regulator [Sinorhizobium mexicanum]|uniref:Uncharacterized protein n=1 Tax=Sinorhizobium mexicanum TaxID=375549 RepID=A0A859R1Z5_9HYPH|nr:hypothetical protein [Sinorhizobium mexicanum]MBP1884732.1 hypothetical protein [Sinorhizobium mexicanum]QLL65619.1 hypothetical protein FKV68_30380 [Sinorhizobium mexicanum]
MYEHLSECCVFLPDSVGLFDGVSLQVAQLCETTIDNGLEKIFLFIDGEVVAKAFDRWILMRVGATNLIASHAIRIALEASIFDVAAFAPEEFVWRSADQAPPAPIESVLPPKIVELNAKTRV